MDIATEEKNAVQEFYKRKRWWQSRLIVAAAVVAVLIAGALALTAARDGSRTAQEPVVEGPPPYVSASGPVVPERRARLSFTSTGRIKSIAVRPGDQVRQGQLLARLEASSLQSDPTAPAGAGSDLYIVAPFDGTVGLVPANEWESVTVGTPVIVLGDLSTLRVEIEDLSESDVGRLAAGQSADITFEAFPNRKVSGRVARISPMNNGKGGGVNYDVIVDLVGASLPPVRWGMTAHVEIRVDGGG